MTPTRQAEAVSGSGAPFGAYLQKQYEEYARIIREAGIKAEWLNRRV